MSDNSDEEWFASWFDSEFYHILYGQRDENEAAGFIRALITTLELNQEMSVLDLACGKGRYTRVFHRNGFQAVGVDLSPESIAFAKLNSPKEIRFEVADMRAFDLNQQFDVVANLFTSFGYFETMEDNLKVLQQVKKHLKPAGVFILDFFNARVVVEKLIPEQTIEREEITFQIQKSVQGEHIVKDISFEANGKSHQFQERVQALGLPKLKELLQKAGFKVDRLFGSYELDTFNEHESPRLILVCTHE